MNKANSYHLRLLAALLTIGLIGAFTPNHAHATSILTYTGRYFSEFIDGSTPGSYTTAMRVTATIELATALPANHNGGIGTPIAFSFSDGRATITSAAYNFVSFYFITDGDGDIIAWDNDVRYTEPIDERTAIARNITTRKGGNAFDGGAMMLTAHDIDQATAFGPGVWSTHESPVPEPSTLSLLAIGLAGLGFRLWKRRS